MNGTTIPTGRDSTYTPAETVPAVKTGRAVFVDSEKYESDTAYKARVDKYVAEGFYMVTDGSVPEGSGGGGSNIGLLEVNASYDVETDAYTLDKTWQEISDAFPNAYISIIGDDHTLLSIASVIIFNTGTDISTYEVRSNDLDFHLHFQTDQPDGYPVSSDDPK